MGEVARKEARELLKKYDFKYQQHIENVVVDLMVDYPSLKEVLEDAGQKGVRYVYVGKNAPNSKPTARIEDEAIIFHP